VSIALLLFHFLVIVYLLLIKFLIPHYIVIHLFNPSSKCCLESGLYFQLVSKQVHFVKELSLSVILDSSQRCLYLLIMFLLLMDLIMAIGNLV
jgi:hypothetical protein